MDKEPKTNKKHNFTPEQVAEIRAKRAETNEDGKPVYSHLKLSEMFDTSPGTISLIVRNIRFKDPDYTPTNDIHGTKVEFLKSLTEQG